MPHSFLLLSLYLAFVSLQLILCVLSIVILCSMRIFTITLFLFPLSTRCFETPGEENDNGTNKNG